VDFSYSDEQAAAIDLARQILTDHCTPKHLRSLDLAGGERFDRALWTKLAEAGLLAAGIPEAHGGAGMGFLTVAGIVEQVGRTAAPVPLLEGTVMGALPIAAFGTGAQQERWLPRIARGEAIVTSALVERHRATTAPGTQAVRDGDACRLAGEKLAVPAGPIADAFLVPAAHDGGVGVFLVEANARGLVRESLVTTSRQPESILRLDGALGEPLGDVARGVEIASWIEERATAALCALAVACAPKRYASPPSTPRRASSSISRSRPSKPSASAPPTRSSTPRRFA
jgi:alkylation response protein AidB-like acyl-CoA dehydrogenase